MELNNLQLGIIREHTMAVYPHEAVIAITQDNAYPLENIHEDPCNQFRVDAKAFYKLKPVALVHSHPTSTPTTVAMNNGNYVDARTPSVADMTTQMNMDIPFGIISYDGIECTDIIWFPDLDSPIEGQSYMHGVYDCWRLIRAYFYQKHNVTLMDIPRDAEWYEANPNTLSDNFTAAGFHPIIEDELQEGDVLLLRVIGDYVTHTAVYIDPDTILHHINNRLSGIDSYPRWRKRVTNYLRYDPTKASI